MPTDRTEALDIEAIERTIRQGVQVLRLGVTENARMDPADAAEHEVLTALDRLIQALRAFEGRVEALEHLRELGAEDEASLRAALKASNEERERVREALERIAMYDLPTTPADIGWYSLRDIARAALSHPDKERKVFDEFEAEDYS